MKDRIRGMWIKVVLASIAMPTSLAYGSTTDSNPANQSLGNSADLAAVTKLNTPQANLVLGSFQASPESL